MKNIRIRDELRKAGMKQWELAEKMNIAETTLCVKLRKELPETEQTRIIEINM